VVVQSREKRGDSSVVLNAGTLTHTQDVLDRWRPGEKDSRLVVDTARMQGEKPCTEQEITAHYDALVWAKENWLRECGLCGGFHFISDKICQGRRRQLSGR